MASLSIASKKEKSDRKKEKKNVIKEGTTNVAESDTFDSISLPLKDVVETKNHNEDSASRSDHEKGNDELEIDLSLSAPLSKKKQRQLKKGKLNLDKITKKDTPPRPATQDGETQATGSSKSPFGVWIGNLSYETTKEDIINHIVSRTKDSEFVAATEKDIMRVNLPKKGTKIKGFAYVDLPSADHVAAVVALSESRLNERNLLIKIATSFEGRPEEHNEKSLLKNPPSRILFIGNLPFDTTDDLLDEHFKPYGEVVRIRMATFEDTGKCKGFAFLDFKDETGPTAALKSKLAKSFLNRNLRLEYGEDRSKRNPKRLADALISGENEIAGYRERAETAEAHEPQQDTLGFTPRERTQKTKRAREYNDTPNKRMKSSVALATAQRGSAAIVPSQGKKVTFA